MTFKDAMKVAIGMYAGFKLAKTIDALLTQAFKEVSNDTADTKPEEKSNND